MIEKGRDLESLRFVEMKRTCAETSSVIRNFILQMDIGSLPKKVDDKTFNKITDLLTDARQGLIVSLKTEGMDTLTLEKLIKETSTDINLDIDKFIRYIERSLNPATEFKLPDEVADAWSLVYATHAKLSGMKEVSYADFSDFDNLLTSKDFITTRWDHRRSPEEWFEFINLLNNTINKVFEDHKLIADPYLILPTGHFFAVASQGDW